MQDTTVAAAVAAKAQLFSEAEQQLRCPRCDSINTKFCYYNNYNLRQPRHFCKSCRRYWTKGGALRNVPVGGSSRKNSSKRPSPSSASPPSDPKRPNSSTPKTESPSLSCPPPQQSRPALNNDESLSSLLASDREFESLINAPVLPSSSCSSEIKFSTGALEMQSSNESSGNEGDNPTEDLLGLLGDSSCWANWWPDLAME